MRNKVCGGPSTQKETCPKCGTKHTVYRAGSWDWKPKPCPECWAYQFQLDYDDKVKGKTNETK